MVIEPNKEPGKIPPSKGKQEEQPSYQKPPSRDFEREIQRQKDRYPPDKEVVRELRRRAQSQSQSQPRQQVQQESSSTPGFGNALESGLDSMEGQQQQPPVDQKSKSDQPPVKDKPPIKEGPPKKDQKQTQKGQQQPQQQQQVQAPQTGAAQAGTHVAAEVVGTGTGSSVDQIINVFQSNPIFQSHVQTLSVQARGAETEIAVMMANGVNVNVTVMAGGKDLNVVIRGITAEAQAALDNPANQALLQAKLGEKGFVIHQMRTFRGEEPARPTGETARREKGEGTGGQGGPGDEETT